MPLNETYFFQQATVRLFTLMGPSDIMLVFRKIINHLYFYKDEHTQ